jgi:hypothetical protein
MASPHAAPPCRTPHTPLTILQCSSFTLSIWVKRRQTGDHCQHIPSSVTDEYSLRWSQRQCCQASHPPNLHLEGGTHDAWHAEQHWWDKRCTIMCEQHRGCACGWRCSSYSLTRHTRARRREPSDSKPQLAARERGLREQYWFCERYIVSLLARTPLRPLATAWSSWARVVVARVATAPPPPPSRSRRPLGASASPPPCARRRPSCSTRPCRTPPAAAASSRAAVPPPPCARRSSAAGRSTRPCRTPPSTPARRRAACDGAGGGGGGA